MIVGTSTHDGTRPDLRAWVGWTLVGLLTAGVLLTWAPGLGAALGDNHEGRILARHALSVANARADGLAASGWLSDWSPYVGDGGEQTSYAHHPPLLNLGYYATARLLPVAQDTAMRVFSYLVGVAMLPAGAAVLRRIGMRWVPTLLATTVVAVTPLFWVYGRISGNLTLLLLMVLAVVRVAEPRRVRGGELATACVASLAAIVAGYLGLAMAALLGLWLLRRRGLDAVTVWVGVAMMAGAAISLGYVIGSTGAARVGEQVQMRTVGGDFTAGEFVARIVQWATSLLPWWWRWIVLPVALVAGVVDRRTRALTLLTSAVTVLYVVGLPNGSYIHDYWILPVLLPVWFGTAALAAGWDRRWPGRELALGATAAVVVVVLGGVHGLSTDVPSRYLLGPQAAGELARDHPPAAQQTVAWRTAGIAAPRWLSLYWDLPPGQVGRDDVGELGADDVVLVRLARAPAWLADGDADAIRAVATAERGDYALLTGAAVTELAE